MAHHGARTSHIPHIAKRMTRDILVPIHNTNLAAPMAELPMDIIIRALNDSNIRRHSLECLQIVPSARLHMLFLVKGNDGNQYLLTLSPPPGVRLLRHERSSTRSEAIVLQWFSSMFIQRRTRSTRAVISQEGNPPHAIKDVQGHPGSQPPAGSLDEYIPELTKHGLIDHGGPTFYSISTPSLGTAISHLSIPLSPGEQNAVDFQRGQLLRRLSLYQSPNQMFGMAAHLLPPLPNKSQANPQRRSSQDSSTGIRCSRWSEAFHILLESALRDAEDLVLTISYDRIRYQFSRFRHLLDGVRRPCFVAIDIGDDTNTLVQRLDANQVTDSSPGDVHDAQTRRKASSTRERIKVTGLRDWSHCIFGDPLVASAFSRDPSPEFFRGFHSRLQPAEQGLMDHSSSPTEDTAHAHVRLLLYDCFHTVVAIVKEVFRWRHDSHTRELAERKRLLDILARLDGLDDLGNPRHEPPDVQSIPAKRTKSQDR